MTHEIQLIEWVKGNPIHNTENDECCPDFSCCKPDLLASKEDRIKFAQYVAEENEAMQMEMLFGFLAKAFSHKPIYIAGMPVDDIA